MRNLLASLLISTLFLISHYEAHAGAWTQEKDHGMLAFSATYYTSNEFYDDGGTAQPTPYYRKHETSLYGEYGLTGITTIGTNLFLNHAQQSGKHNVTLGNNEFFLRQRLYRDATRVISLEPRLILPRFETSNHPPHSGNKSIDADIALLYGESFTFLSSHDFMDVTGGLRARTRGLSPQWRASWLYGTSLTDKIQIISGMSVISSFNRDTPAILGEGEDLDYQLTKSEIRLLYTQNSGQYWQLSTFNHIAGNQVGAGNGFSLSYGMKF
jgi:hypothetical protein